MGDQGSAQHVKIPCRCDLRRVLLLPHIRNRIQMLRVHPTDTLKDRLHRVSLLTGAAGVAGAVHCALTQTAHARPVLMAGGRLGGVAVLFGTAKTCSWLCMPEHPALNSLVAGGVAIALPNAFYSQRRALLREVYKAHTGRLPGVATVLAYSAVSGALLLGGMDVIVQVVSGGQGF